MSCMIGRMKRRKQVRANGEEGRRAKETHVEALRGRPPADAQQGLYGSLEVIGLKRSVLASVIREDSPEAE